VVLAGPGRDSGDQGPHRVAQDQHRQGLVLFFLDLGGGCEPSRNIRTSPSPFSTAVAPIYSTLQFTSPMGELSVSHGVYWQRSLLRYQATFHSSSHIFHPPPGSVWYHLLPLIFHLSHSTLLSLIKPPTPYTARTQRHDAQVESEKYTK